MIRPRMKAISIKITVISGSISPPSFLDPAAGGSQVPVVLTFVRRLMPEVNHVSVARSIAPRRESPNAIWPTVS